MRVGITGASGIIGRELVQACSEKPDIVPISIVRNLKSDENHNNTTFLSDYSLESMASVLNGIDAVVHLAALRGGAGSIKTYQINEILVENTLAACVRLNIKNFIYISSISVYSGYNKIPWNESIIPKPENIYGVSKLCGEAICNIYSQKYDISVKILRLAHVVSGEEKNKYMINRFIERASRKEQLIVQGKSIAKREFIYVKDVGNAILLALSHNGSDVFNIGTGVAYSNLEVAEIINRVYENSGNLLYLDLEDEGIKSSCMDITKAEEVLGFIPTFNFEEAIRDISKTENM